jgi:hypothetical protein
MSEAQRIATRNGHTSASIRDKNKSIAANYELKMPRRKIVREFGITLILIVTIFLLLYVCFDGENAFGLRFLLWISGLLLVLTVLAVRQRLVFTKEGVAYQSILYRKKVSWEEIKGIESKNGVDVLLVAEKKKKSFWERWMDELMYWGNIPLSEFSRSWKEAEIGDILRENLPDLEFHGN